jgi:diguanylate cyclase (GGDEF)-like protein/PAS domain S-box-containing protein
MPPNLEAIHSLPSERGQRPFGDLIDQVPDAMFLSHLSGRLVDVNVAACQLLGLSRDALLKMSLSDRDIDSDVESLWQRVVLLKPGQPLVAQRQYLRYDGTTVPVEARFSRIDNDCSAMVLAIVRDQSAELVSSSKLRESQERFRSCFEHASIGVALVRPDGRWLAVNPSLCRILGYDEHELLSCDFQSITHPDDLEGDMTLVRQVLAGAISEYQLEKRYFHKSGKLVWALLNVSLVRGENGKPLYFISQIQDITSHKQALEALRANEEEFRAIFELSGVGKAQLDLRTGRLLRTNAQWSRILGYNAEELSKLAFADLTHPDESAEAIAASRKLRDGQSTLWSAETRCLRKDGKSIWTLLNVVSLHNPTGPATHAVATIQDITERKMDQRFESDRSAILEMVTQDSPLKYILEVVARAVETQLQAPAAVFVVQDGVLSVQGPSLPRHWIESLQSGAFSIAPALAASAWTKLPQLGVTSVQSDPAWSLLWAAGKRAGFENCWTVVINSEETASAVGLISVFVSGEREPSERDRQILQRSAELASICVRHHTTTRQLAHLVRHDLLTGLPNRVLFQDRLQQALTIARRSGKHVGLLAIDVDCFKQINDTYGHDVGDSALQQFATRVRKQLRQMDTIARIGGDEFIAVSPELSDPHGAATVARKIIECLGEPFLLAGKLVSISASVGVALYPDNATDAQELMRIADNQLYRTKHAGRNGFSVAGVVGK